MYSGKTFILCLFPVFLAGLILFSFPDEAKARRWWKYGEPAPALKAHYDLLRSEIYEGDLMGKNRRHIRFYVAVSLHDLAGFEWPACEHYRQGQGEDCNGPVRARLEQLAEGLASGKGNIEGIKSIFEYVRKGIRYSTEKGNIPKFPYETLVSRKGDCEDQATLLAVLLKLAGFESGVVRIDDPETGFRHVVCIVRVGAGEAPVRQWSFSEYPEYGYCWMMLDAAYSHPFSRLPKWLSRYRRADGKCSLPPGVTKAVIIDKDEYQKLCREADYQQVSLGD